MRGRQVNGNERGLKQQALRKDSTRLFAAPPGDDFFFRNCRSESQVKTVSLSVVLFNPHRFLAHEQGFVFKQNRATKNIVVSLCTLVEKPRR